MSLNTKEALCTYVNSKVTARRDPRTGLWKVPLLGKLFPYFFAIQKVHVPIYTKPWKIKAIRALQKKVYTWVPHFCLEEMEREDWTSRWDFSKFIWPDQWKTYPIQAPIALPKYTSEYEHCWVISPLQAFYQEDLTYGLRPMAIFEQLVDIGECYMWVVNKQDQHIYETKGSQALFLDVAQDFKLFLEQQPSSIPWAEQQVA